MQILYKGKFMKKTALLLGCLVMMGSSLQAYSWNLEAKNINALRFIKDGTIRFTLFDAGDSGPEYICNQDDVEEGQWLFITSCNKGKGKGNKSASPNCIASVDRMASMLLEAKTSGRSIHVEVDSCKVREVALKPDIAPEVVAEP